MLVRQSHSRSRSVDVVVVGAGLSGLRAATIIQNTGLSCVVLEAMPRVGGKTLSHQTTGKGGGIVDLGAAWINDTNQSEIYRLACQFGFELIPQRAQGLSLHQTSQGAVVSFPYGTTPEDPDDDLPNIRGFVDALNDAVEKSDLEDPSRGSDASLLDSMTMEEYARKDFGQAGVFMSNELARAFLGVEAEELSALYLVNYIKSGTGLANMSSDLRDGGQYLRNRHGNQSFSTRLSEMLAEETLYLSSPVSKVTQLGEDRCVVETEAGLGFECKRVVISIPTCLYPTIEFDPALPPGKQALSSSTALGYYAKTVFVFDAPWWREAGLSGAFTSHLGPISFTRDTCSEADGQFSITCFLVGDPGRRWSKFSAAERRRQVEAQFVAIFGSMPGVSKVPEPIEVIEMEWAKEPWARGAPNPVMMPRTLAGDAGKSMREPFRNVHFCGTETSVVWKGYLEGAVRAGMRAAEEVSRALT